jgi:uncharacterized protein YjbI with pentapeptide repeats
MANEEQLAILKKGVYFWNEWRKKNPNIRPSLKDAYLKGENLCDANFTEANFIGASLNHADLSAADFSAAHLIGADLMKAVLTYTQFDGALLWGANFREAQLYSAHFMKADLKQADFISTSLRRADFTEATLTEVNLMNADLTGANLTGADLTGAVLDNTTLANIDLSSVKGLETVKHGGPSAVGIDTLYRSQGKIPEVFLRGAGVPEIFIQYLPSLVSSPIEFYSCFISYSHEDKFFARRLHDALQGKGIRCWLDEKQILPGEDIYAAVDRGVRLWDKVLLCCSESSLTSWWVDNEIGTAFEKEQQLNKERGEKVLALIPLNLDGYLFSEKWNSGYRAQIRRRLAADFTGWESDNKKFEEQFERVVLALRTQKPAELQAPTSRL